MARSGDIDDVEVVFRITRFEMGVDENSVPGCPKCPTNAAFTCASVSGSRQQRIVIEIYLRPTGKFGRAPIGGRLAEVLSQMTGGEHSSAQCHHFTLSNVFRTAARGSTRRRSSAVAEAMRVCADRRADPSRFFAYRVAHSTSGKRFRPHVHVRTNYLCIQPQRRGNVFRSDHTQRLGSERPWLQCVSFVQDPMTRSRRCLVEKSLMPRRQEMWAARDQTL